MKFERPAGAVTVTCRKPTVASDATAICTGSEVLVLPLRIVTVTPPPVTFSEVTTFTEVTSSRFVPVIVPVNVVPVVPRDGEKVSILGGTNDCPWIVPGNMTRMRNVARPNPATLFIMCTNPTI